LYFFFISLVYPLIFKIKGQEYDHYFRNYTVSQGLPSNSIYALAKDSDGFVWIGTSNGLSRFDAYDFKVLRKSDPHVQLPDNEIMAIENHPEGYLWLGHYSSGLSLFDPKSQKVIANYQIDSQKHPLKDNRILSLYQEGDSLLFIGLHYNFFQMYDIKRDTMYDYSDKLLEEKKIASSLHNIHSFNSDPYDKNILWICTGAGLVKWNRKSGKFDIFNYNNDKISTSLHNSMRYIVFQGDSAMFIGSWGGGLIYFNHKRNTWKNYIYDNRLPLNGTRNIIRKIARKSDSELWIATHDSAFGVFDIASNKFFFYKHYPDDMYSAINQECYTFLNESIGAVWIGTSNGLSYLHPSNQLIQRFRLSEGNTLFQRTFYSYEVYLNRDKNQLYLGNRDSEYFDAIHLNSETLISYPLPGLLTITKILKFKDFYYIFTFRNGVYKWKNNKFTRVKISQVNALNQSACYTACIVRDGTVYMATANKGLVIFNEARNFYKEIPTSEAGLSNSALENGIFTVFADSEERIWIGTLPGLAVYEPKSGFKFKQTQKGNVNSLMTEIRQIYQDSKGMIWAVSASSGIFGLRVKRDTIQILRHINEKGILFSDQLYSTAIDKNDKIYLATPIGIQVFDLKTNTSLLLNYSNGLKPYQSIIKLHYTPDHFLNLSLNNEINRIDLKKIDARFIPNEPQILLSSISILQGEELVAKQQKLVLNYTQNFINFSFTTLHYENPADVVFQYRIKGEEVWQTANKNKGLFTHLPYGKHILEVRTSTVNNTWSTPQDVFHFTILPPFWLTYWFKFLMVSALLLVIYSFYRFRIHQIQKESQLKSNFEKRLAEVKLEALRAQMNPHFLFNSLNSINYFILIKREEIASDYLTKFSQLLRHVLANSRNEWVNLNNEIQVLELYCTLESMRFKNKFEYQIHIDSSINTSIILIPPMLIQPFVENAIWHGLLNKENHDGKLDISFDRDGKNLKITIKDNGIGREKARQLKSKSATKHKSFGLQITSERFELIKNNLSGNIEFSIKDLYDPNQNAAGTCVEITLLNCL
jgi:ligand-binding sensor domain-containing protein